MHFAEVLAGTHAAAGIEDGCTHKQSEVPGYRR